MAKNGNYPVWVFAGKDGKMHIGAKSCKNYDDLEQIYGSQIPHRCVAYDRQRNKYRLLTPTEAAKDKNRYVVTD